MLCKIKEGNLFFLCHYVFYSFYVIILLRMVIKMSVTLKYLVNENQEISIETEIKVIKDVGIGKNQTRMVKYAEEEIGFLKNSSKTTSATLDNLEYFISNLGKHILGVNVADIHKAYDNGEFLGTISKNVARENETLIMLSEIIETLMEEEKPEVIEIASQINEIKNRNVQQFHKKNGMIEERAILEEEEDIKQIIEMFPKALDLISVPTEQKENIKKEYFKMIIFDILTNQVDRNNNNYGIVYDKKNETTRFSELFDNSTIHIPGLPDTHYCLNGFLINRKSLIGCLLDNYGAYVNEIVIPIAENRDVLLEKTRQLSKKTLTESEQEMFMPLFERNLNDICEMTKEKTTSTKK